MNFAYYKTKGVGAPQKNLILLLIIMILTRVFKNDYTVRL